ncbi:MULTISPECIES: hypothetical protein [Actinokineospora]|uniref:Small CPxCG-related zinc finger protein n=1 Tax=Actinokineospora xionganensis TaxID=2684470 RepID=A0ABR7LCD0_9PSEU|nr:MULTISPECIES: hypothetical protein [Actinokineospora]MBC6450370.1 hypothetical protein [Actinokineospora xionganensis]
MGRHRDTSSEGRSLLSLFGGRRRQADDLFDRSFRSCDGCGADVYILAEECRGCGDELVLRAG